MANLVFSKQFARAAGHFQLQSDLVYGSLEAAKQALSGSNWIAIGDIVTISGVGTTELYTVSATGEANGRLTGFELRQIAMGGSQDVVNLQTALGTTSSAITIDITKDGAEPFEDIKTVESALTNIYGMQVVKTSQTSASAFTYHIQDKEGRDLATFNVDKDKFLKTVETVTVDDEPALQFVFETYDTGTSEFHDVTQTIKVSDILGIPNPISGVSINGITGVIENYQSKIVISGSDINVGTYTAITYPEEFSAATPISGDLTVAEAFHSVEHTISALTQEIIDDEEVTRAAIQAIASGAGLIHNDIIKYEPDPTCSIITAATSLAEADLLLGRAIQGLQEYVVGGVSGQLSQLLTINNGYLQYTSNPVLDCGYIDNIN